MTRFGTLAIFVGLSASVLAWDSKIHTGIIHASLMAMPPGDRIQERWGDEAGRLREYVQMGDWVNTFVSQQEIWETGGQKLEQTSFQFFANDYLMFPGVARSFQHSVPDVKNTYRPYFLRALQALRTESPANAARWTGSLLHFVTDSGSPPHTIGVTGADHTKMESWLDTSLIDLSNYHPAMLGDSDAAAAQGLLSRMDGLIAFSAIRAKQLLPLVKVNDRAKMEPIALESAAETARVAADVIHTLLLLTQEDAQSKGGTLVADVSVPAMEGMENLPAKLVLLKTSYSTLSEQSLPSFRAYRGKFLLRDIPEGNYAVAVERVGSRTLYVPAITIKAGETAHASWKLLPSSMSGNLVPNSDLSLRWISSDAPDHWHYDAPRHQWMSDVIPVVAGRSYRAACQLKDGAGSTVELQWMSHAWEVMKIPTVPVDAAAETVMQAPAGALFVKFVVKTQTEPSARVRSVSLVPSN